MKRHLRVDRSQGAGRREAPARRRVAAGLAAALALLALAFPTAGVAVADTAATAAPVRIAVFDFVLDDRSAGGGVIAADPVDAEHLAASTAEARRRLAESGRYEIVDTASAAAEMEAAGGAKHCTGCEAALARDLGAAQSMIGIVTRVTRTEYAVQIVVRDAGSGEILANAFTGLRMGANYAWPRGVKWLMQRQVLAGE